MTSLPSPADRLTARYGHPVDLTPPSWNETLDLILRHRSVRQWLDRDVDDATLRTVIAAAQSAPSSSNKQVVSVVAVRDQEAKTRLSAVGKQMSAHIVNAPVTLVWLIDYSQARLLAAQEKAAQEKAAQDQAAQPSGAEAPAEQRHGATRRPATDLGALDYLDEPMMAAGDVGIAAQTAAIAAESLGLGTVFLGSLRNNIDEVRDALGIPDSVVPFVGLELGYPDPAENAGVKPRLPMELFLHEGRYNSRSDADGTREHADLLAGYDADVASYFSRYGSHPTWSAQFLNRLTGATTAGSKRQFLRDILTRAGFTLN